MLHSPFVAHCRWYTAGTRFGDGCARGTTSATFGWATKMGMDLNQIAAALAVFGIVIKTRSVSDPALEWWELTKGQLSREGGLA